MAEERAQIGGRAGYGTTGVDGDGTAIAALLLGALVWGVIWYPYRILRDGGVDGVLASTASYGVAFVFGLIFFRNKLRGLRLSWPVFWLALAAGGCNLGYVLATLTGEVMRVLLLFYLAPLWTVLLSRWLLGERLNRFGALIVALSLAGAMTMLWQAQTAFPLPQDFADCLGLGAGFSFALFNVLSRRHAGLGIEAKSMVAFAGVLLVGIPLLLAGGASVHWPAQGFAWGLLFLIGLVLLLVNVVVQFGLARVAANRAIVIMLSEVGFAALAAYFLTDEALQLREWVGGAMILAASLFSAQLEKT